MAFVDARVEVPDLDVVIVGMFRRFPMSGYLGGPRFRSNLTGQESAMAVYR